MSYESFLQKLVVKECEERRHKRIGRYLRESRLPLEKSLASFEKIRLPEKLRVLLNILLEGSFVDRCEKILAFGNPGSGETRQLWAIAQELISKDRRIFFTPCSMLVQDLLVAKKELALPKVLKKTLQV